jgi:hypothetical protein
MIAKRGGRKRARDDQDDRPRPRISLEVEKQIQDLLRTKKGMLAIAKEVGVGSGTVQRIAREMLEERRRRL